MTKKLEPNVELLDAVLEHIKAHPETWRQDVWRCKSGMCFAGTAVDLDERVDWIVPFDKLHFKTDRAQSWTTVPPGQAGKGVLGTDRLELRREGVDTGDTYENAWEVAEWLLGISPAQANALFHSNNDLADLEFCVERIKDHKSLRISMVEKRHYDRDRMESLRRGDPVGYL